MSDDWNSVTKIGSKARGPGAVDRPKTLKTAAELNAARRQGADLTAEKKIGGANKGGDTEGQRARKLDDASAPEPGTTKYVGHKRKAAMQTARNNLKDKDGKTVKQEQVAIKARVPAKVVSALESGKPDTELLPKQGEVQKVEKVVGVYLYGKNVGKKIDAWKNPFLPEETQEKK